MRPTPVFSLLAGVLAWTICVSAQQAPKSPLFPPEELGTLEGPDREEWQQPDKVMDALKIFDGARVADLGAGGGWFTVRLSRRAGPNGVVYAEDIQERALESLQRRVARDGLKNVRTILGTPDDPRLPGGLNAVLLVGLYPQLGDPVSLLRNIGRALAPNGRLGVIDFKKNGDGGPGPPMSERADPEAIERDAARAGLRLEKSETFLRYQYLLVFSK